MTEAPDTCYCVQTINTVTFSHFHTENLLLYKYYFLHLEENVVNVKLLKTATKYLLSIEPKSQTINIKYHVKTMYSQTLVFTVSVISHTF